MDASTALWVAWGLAFVLLEAVGLRSGGDRAFTLTNRLRGLLRSPVGRIVRLGLVLGWVWVAWHLLAVDPVSHPGS